jgi:DNA-binding beta-propeller fold protein YncE
MHPVQLPDGRVLLPSFISGRKRLLVGKPGESLRPFVETADQSSPPVAVIGRTHLAYLGGGTATHPPLLTLASVTDGRVATRFESTQGLAPLALTAAPDGLSLYVVEAGTISKLDIRGGALQKLRPGNGIAVDPRNGDLIAQVNDKDGVHLLRVPAAGAEVRIPIPAETKISTSPIAGNAVAPDGRLLITVSSKENWFAGPAIVDPATGAVTRVPVQFEGDILPSTWGEDGTILGMGTGLKSELWRFRPLVRGK